MTAERIIMVLLILGVAWGCVVVIGPFSSALLWAAILAYVTWPAYVWLRSRTGAIPAVILMTILCATGVLVPVGLVASEGISAGPAAVESIVNTLFPEFRIPAPPAWVARIPGIGAELQATWGQTANDIRHLSEVVRPYAGNITESALSLLVQLASGGLHLVMAIFIAIFFWLSGDSLGKTISSLFFRIAGEKAPRILSVIGGTIRGTVYGILGTALIQGILTATGFALTGLPEPVLFGAIAAFLAVLPIGAPLVWVPGAIWLAMSHHLWKGIALALYGIIIISGIDHFIRPAFIARGAQMPYLLTLIGVVGGILEFGGLGIFLGPVLLAVGYTLTVEFAAGGRTAIMTGNRDPGEQA
ncbi:AI-2E family transporter [Acetobacter sp. AN02]|uniref:AI-2E family transporter n=1 Tax=Acetobacter sp. AN02 TaxID=2894186 RepID=UPI0024341595|nr:AI-2E family transporter [Acetobacter sp. AN02]MDG6095225.1 AI-2E family transporter [Acetobacter sp. AN02]